MPIDLNKSRTLATIVASIVTTIGAIYATWHYITETIVTPLDRHITDVRTVQKQIDDVKIEYHRSLNALQTDYRRIALQQSIYSLDTESAVLLNERQNLLSEVAIADRLIANTKMHIAENVSMRERAKMQQYRIEQIDRRLAVVDIERQRIRDAILSMPGTAGLGG